MKMLMDLMNGRRRGEGDVNEDLIGIDVVVGVKAEHP